MKKQNIKKIGLLCIQNKKLLVVYKPKIGLYITPGGKLEPNETDIECLKRELREEIGCSSKNLTYFGAFYGKTSEGYSLRQICYLGNLKGNITLNQKDTIKDYAWIDKSSFDNIPLGSMLKEKIIPALSRQGYL